MTVESLEPRHLLTGLPMLTEFMAKNEGFWEDGDGNAPDWIEIQNVGDTTLDLAGPESLSHRELVARTARGRSTVLSRCRSSLSRS